MRTERVLILGAGYAGLRAAVRLAPAARDRAEVVVIDRREVFLERIRQHQVAAGDRLRERPVVELLAGTGVRFVPGAVRRIDAPARLVDVDGTRQPYDRLVIALGSRVDVDAAPGVRAHGFTMDAPSTAALAAALPGIAGVRGRLLVVGGGFSGIEIVAELAARYPDLGATLSTAGTLGAGLSERGAAHVRAVLARLGVTVLEHAPVRAVEAGRVHLDDRELPADAVVWAGGCVAPPLLRAAGLATNARGQALVDATLRSISHPDVFVAGDAAAIEGRVGAPVCMACKTAQPMGAHVGDNVARLLDGREPEPLDFGDSGVCLSLGRREGLVDLRRRDGVPSGRIFTGRLAAIVKERICRYTVWSLDAERRGWLRFRWPGRAAHLGGPGMQPAPGAP